MDAPVHTIEFEVGPELIDNLGHVSNIHYLQWVLAAAEAHSDAVGFDFAAYQRLGWVFVVRRHEIDYLRPAFAGNRISVSTWVMEFRAASSTRGTEIRRGGRSGELLARAATTWAFVSLENGRPGRIPAEIAALFAG
jgi:acyl-CoA thioester hydrolase